MASVLDMRVAHAGSSTSRSYVSPHRDRSLITGMLGPEGGGGLLNRKIGINSFIQNQYQKGCKIEVI